MLTGKKMTITVMAFVLTVFVGAAAHRNTVAADRFIVTKGRLIVAGDREGRARHLMANETWLYSNGDLVAGDRDGRARHLMGNETWLYSNRVLVAGDRDFVPEDRDLVADRDFRAAAYRNA
jgi:hypothetical protein